MTTVLEIIDGGTRYLEKRGIAEARRNMQLLVAHFLGWTRMELYLKFDETVAEERLELLRDSLKKRGEGIPLQHLLGTVWFHNRELKTDGRALIPRPETEELAEFFLRENIPAGARILDMGCGSGVLGLTLAAEKPDWQVVLVDLSGEALELARENADRLEIKNVEFIQSDLFAKVPGRFDGIVANLPYVAETEKDSLAREVLHDPALALFGGMDGMEVIRPFCEKISAYVAPGCVVGMEVAHDQGERTRTLLAEAGAAETEIRNDLSGVARFPFARWK